MYSTLADIKEYLGINDNEFVDNELLQSLADGAQKLIDTFTGRTFEASADTTRYFDAVANVDGNTLYFDGDICAITTVTNGNGVVVANTEYTKIPRNATPYHAISLKQSSGKTWVEKTNGDSEDAITVVGRWAYSTTAPADIAFCHTRLTAYLYRQKDNANDLDRAVVAGNSTILPANLPKDIMTILQSYKRIV